MAAKALFYYFGDDEAYFKALSGEFSKNTRMSFEFKRIFHATEVSIQSLFLNVSKDLPSVVFIDFSKHTQDYLHLARIIARTPFNHKLVTVGLVDYLSPPEVLSESIATGVDLTHIKSAETFDVIFDVIKLLAPNEIGEHGFATATLKETWDAGLPVKVGFVRPEGLHFETDLKIEKGSRIRLHHHWLEKKTVPSKEMFVTQVSEKNLFYHFQYAVDAEFLFVDEFLPPEDMDPVDVEQRKKEREDLIIYHRKQLKKWLEDNESRSLQKKAKVLIVDRDYSFYHNQPRTDKHPFTIRCVASLENPEHELNRLEPQVIAFALDKEDVKEPLNNNESLLKLIRSIRKCNSADVPFIVVFNCEKPSKELQENFQYDHIMATKNDISTDILLRMAQVFEKKLEDKSIMMKKEDCVFLKKTNTDSIAEILLPIEVLKLSETDMIFQCETPLPIGINLHLKTPVNMYINVQPGKGQGKVPDYHGLIHSLGEVQKKELRKVVNGIFFRDHDAQVQAETEEFKNLNEKIRQQREEELKAQKEAEEQKNEEAPESDS